MSPVSWLRSPPSLADDITVVADWVECAVRFGGRRRFSQSDLIGIWLRDGDGQDRTGLGAGRGLDSDVEERAQRRSCEAWIELARRVGACGRGFPFLLEDDVIQRGSKGLVYEFLLALSTRPWNPADQEGVRLFEELSTAAARVQVHGDAFHFGYPRPEGTGFREAVEQLCRKWGEGAGLHGARCTEDVAVVKDDALDVVAWRGFPDRQRGMLTLFGQCATGGNWEGKQTELLPCAWCGQWLCEFPTVLPVRAFFVPRVIEPSSWDATSRKAGVIFDRCRIVSCTSGRLPRDLRNALQKWLRDAVRARVN